MGLFFHAKNSNDPPEVRNWRIHLMAVIVSMGSLAMGYDTSVIGGTMALDSFKRDFALGHHDRHTLDTIQGNIVSTFQAGTFFGALLTFPLGERFGRKRAIIGAGCIFLAGGVLMTAASGHLGLIYAGRAVAGLGIGSVSLLVPVYIAETSPPSIRGRLVGIFEILSQGGGMLGFWINYACDQTISVDSKKQWMIPLALQLIPGFLLLVGVTWCPESPRWYAKNNNWEAATKTLTWIRMLPADHESILAELQEIKEQTLLIQSSPKLTPKQTVKRLIAKGTRNRIGIGLLLMACQNLTGVNIITYYAPRIFETLGITGTSTKLFSTGFYGVAKTLGMIVFSAWLVEKVGRRKGLIYGAFIGSLPMWYLGGYVFQAKPAETAELGQYNRDAAGYVAMVCVYLYGFIYCMTWQGITWVYCSEIFPLDIRMVCVAITTADQWLWSFVISRTTPYMITSLGYGTYMFFASLMILMGIWAFFFIPETKGRSLEEMEAIFGGKTRDGDGDAEKPREEHKHVGLKDSADPSASGVKADSGEASMATTPLKST